MKKVVLIVLNNFKNDSRVLREAMSLKRAGYEVCVAALFEERLEEFDTIQGIKVHRIKLKTKKWGNNKLIHLLKYFEFFLKVVIYFRHYDIFHCNDIETLPIGVFVKIFIKKNSKIVYDAHEYEIERYNQNLFEKKVVKFIENIFIKFADKVITVSESIAKEYARIYNISLPYIILNTPNFKKLEYKNDIFRKKFNIPHDYVIFLYQGGLSSGRGILEFVDMIKDFNKVAYVIMGYGYLENEIREIVKKEKNIFFQEAVPPNKLIDYTSSADIGVCIEENLCKSWDFALPNKMFEYFMAEIPIVVSGLTEMKQFVRKYDVGYVLEKDFDKSEFKQIFKEIKENYIEKKRNVKKIKEIFNWENQEKKLIEIYKNLEEE